MRFTLPGWTVQCGMEERADGSVKLCFPQPLWAGHAADNDHRRTSFTEEGDGFSVLATPPKKRNQAPKVWFNVTNGCMCWRVTVTFPKGGCGSVGLASEPLSVKPDEIFLARKVMEYPLRSNSIGGAAELLRVFDYGAAAAIEVPSRSYEMRVVRGEEMRRSIRVRPISTVRPRSSERLVQMSVSAGDLLWMLDVSFAREGLTSSLTPV